MGNHGAGLVTSNPISKTWYNARTVLFQLQLETALVIPWQAPMQAVKHTSSHQALVETMQ